MPRDVEDIVEEIADNLRPWRHRDRRKIEQEIRERLGEMRYELDVLKALLTPASLTAALDKIEKRAAALAAEIEAADEFRKVAALCGFSLEPLRTALDVFRSRRGGRSGHFKWENALCAESAYKLIIKFSETSPSSTEDGPFRTIAGLLFEAITGEQEADLKRACDDVMRRRRQSVHS